MIVIDAPLIFALSSMIAAVASLIWAIRRDPKSDLGSVKDGS
ncbi:hypothetical protein SAMN04488568_11674 [Maricaulis salignorans]|uniref:Uncharacterized protein n=1 Tax=Maricaulis salignorans TaxID=144026 RepID=A0A1G9UUQ6_9PROT|nr:hypothetical protein SAMN04488568_11674 [Maricaulis salignorans]